MVTPENNPASLDPFEVRKFLSLHSRVQDGTAVSECCYHYTKANVLEEFLKDGGDILCTHCRTVNDQREFITGVNVLASYMKMRNWNQGLANRIVSQLRGFAQFDLGMPWIFSLSIFNDSLFQWTNYTDRDEGGYAVGFSLAILQQLAEKRVIKCNQNSRHAISTFFLPCLYEGIDNIFGWLDTFLSEYIISGAVYAADIKEPLFNQIYSCASIAPMFIKDKSFFMEGEWRLVLEPNFDTAYCDIVSIGGRPRLRACVKDDIGSLRDVIKSVIVSPHGNKESLYLNALNLKRRQKANFSIAVSSSTYRG